MNIWPRTDRHPSMSQFVKVQESRQYETSLARQPDQNDELSGTQQVQELYLQNTPQDDLSFLQQGNVSNNFVGTCSQIKYEQFSTNSLNFSTSKLMMNDALVSQSPMPPLRFSEVQKSIEVLRRAIPSIVDDALVDKIYFAILGNFNNIVQHREQSNARQKVKVSQSFHNSHSSIKFGQKKNINHQFKSNQFNIDKKTFRDKMRIFEQQENQRAMEKQIKEQQKPYRKKNQNEKKLTQIWNSQMENDFVELFRKGSLVQDIKIFLIKKYPHYKEYFTYSQVRCEGYKILRFALRKLYHIIGICQDMKLPELFKLTQIRSNFIFYYKHGAKVRCFLAQLFKLEDFNYDLLSKLIISINNLCISMQQNEDVIQKIGHRKSKSRTKPSNNFGFDHSKTENNNDFYYEDDNAEVEPAKFGFFQRK